MVVFIAEHLIFDENGTIKTALCRECGDEIARGGMRGVKLPAYRQLQFTLSDGSLYEPPFCVGCAKKRAESGFTLDELKELWEVELYTWDQTLQRTSDGSMQAEIRARHYMTTYGLKFIVSFDGMKPERDNGTA